MTLQKKDFIEIEFTGKIKHGEIFDSNIKEDIEKVKLNTTPKPLVFCLGEGMFLKGVDDFLIGKEIGKYTIELSPEKAFGNRESKLVQMIPMKVFHQHKINPVPGAMFNFDNRMAKILTVSGGRVMVDFNNPLSGKDIVYDIKVLRKVEDTNEKIKSFNEFLFRKDFKFKIKDKKLILEVEKQMTKFVEMFRDKFKDIFDLELEVKEVEEKEGVGGMPPRDDPSKDDTAVPSGGPKLEVDSGEDKKPEEVEEKKNIENKEVGKAIDKVKTDIKKKVGEEIEKVVEKEK